jgi:hypothetical protein
VSDFTKSHISGTDDWRTPDDILEILSSDYFFDFDDDPCPIGGTGGLEREWGQCSFLNPPYSNPTPWVKKAYEESKKGKTVVGLLRGDTSTRWFHDWVLDKADLIFVKGRLHFNGKGPAPFPSIIAVWPKSTSGLMKPGETQK